MTRPRVLVVDNFDSFTYNLVEYASASADVEVVRNTVSLETIADIDPDGIVLSPGPGHPRNERDVGVTAQVLREVSPATPTFGVCLGLEAAVHEYGGTVGHAPEPVHGKASPIDHDGRGVFQGIAQGFQAGRYHSLVATDIPSCFSVTARTGDLVMGVRHREHPIECVQFHPESVLTGVGRDIVENFVSGLYDAKRGEQIQGGDDHDCDERDAPRDRENDARNDEDNRDRDECHEQLH